MKNTAITTYRTLSFTSLGSIGFAILVVAVRYPILLNYRGGLSGWVGFLATLLVVLGYGLLVSQLARLTNPYGLAVIPPTRYLAWLIGSIWVIHLSLEYFTAVSETTSRFIFLTIFFLYGVSGYQAARHSPLRAWRVGSLAGMLVAIFSTCLLVVYGFSLNFLVPSRLSLLLQADFKRSGLADPIAYVYLNTLESAFSHLLFSLLIGGVLGLVGGLVNSLRQATGGERHLL